MEVTTTMIPLLRCGNSTGVQVEDVAANGMPLSDRLHKVDSKDLLQKLGWNWNWNCSKLELE
jgi:hypothetical protein